MASDKFSTTRSDSAISFGSSAIAHTPADTDLPINVKAVVFDAAGTISYKNAAGDTAITGYPVAAGTPIPFVPLRITAMTGPAKCFLIQ